MTTFKRVQAAQRLNGGDPINGWIGLILYLVFSPAFYAYAQSGLNATWRAVGAPPPDEQAEAAASGAEGGNRTHTPFRAPDFESGASASSATSAR